MDKGLFSIHTTGYRKHRPRGRDSPLDCCPQQGVVKQKQGLTKKLNPTKPCGGCLPQHLYKHREGQQFQRDRLSFENLKSPHLGALHFALHCNNIVFTLGFTHSLFSYLIRFRIFFLCLNTPLCYFNPTH